MKQLLLRIVALFVAFALAGCGAQNGRTTIISEDGLVRASAFAGLRTGTDVGIFEGVSHDITYQWLYLGTPIDQPQDTCLGVTFSNAGSDAVKETLGATVVQELSFCATVPLPGNPSLTVYLPVAWDVGEVTLYRSGGPGTEPEAVGSATLVNSPLAILTFSPQRFDGLYYLVGTGTPSSAGTDVPAPTAGARATPTASASASATPRKTNQGDAYAEGGSGSGPGKTSSGGGTASSGSRPTKSSGQDKYLTDPVPAGKPQPVEPEDVKVDASKTSTATLSISAATILRHLDQFDSSKMSVLPADGVIMATRKVTFSANESVFDVLKRETKKSGVHMEFSWTPMYNSAYVEGIHNLYEFDCGELSGWMYKVNGWFPNYGASRYQLKAGDKVEWVYTCDLGRDIGGYWEGMEKP